ncbi:MAG TPA: site-specific DNA-methyltransferase [bacterium]|nr:site-specific DNA-methyltransferase [bacterium]
MKKRYRKSKEIIAKNMGTSVIKEQLLSSDIYKSRKFSNIGNVIVYIGDVIKCLRLLPDGIVDCVITSPPYWKQRDYKDPHQIGQESTYQEYVKNLVGVFTEMKRVLKPTGTFFLNVGYKYQNKELLLIPELLAIELQKNGWTLLNKIIWNKPNAMPSSFDSRFSNVYEPVFLFVKNESKYKYYLSIDTLRLPVNNFVNNKNPEDILGFEVENSLLKDKKIKGYISKVFKNSRGDILAQVNWDDRKNTIEIVNDFNKESQISIGLICEDCGRTMKHEIDINSHLNCKGFPKPILPPVANFNNLIELSDSSLFSSVSPQFFQNSRRVYNGKFKLSPDNRGASPGARKSLFGEYFVLQRRYEIFQPIIADYLAFWKRKKNITTKEIDKLLGYKDTAGHWFRKDTGSWGRGGSIPLPDDWFKLKEILEFDNIYDRWITETHLVLQTVRAHPKGKNPGDVWNIKLQPFSGNHFAIFPEELVKRCILSGCPEQGVVLDPFAGSGTTGKVAQELGRDGILIELVPKYLDIIKKRCKNIKEVIYVK